MKKIAGPIAIALIGVSVIMAYNKSNNSVTDSQKKEALKQINLLKNEVEFWNDFLNKISSDELNTIYQVMIVYKHFNNSPAPLQSKFITISEKYNIFT